MAASDGLPAARCMMDAAWWCEAAQYVALMVERLGVPISAADIGLVEDVLLRKLDFRLSVQVRPPTGPCCTLYVARCILHAKCCNAVGLCCARRWIF
jgi:hypothetical protein